MNLPAQKSGLLLWTRRVFDGSTGQCAPSRWEDWHSGCAQSVQSTGFCGGTHAHPTRTLVSAFDTWKSAKSFLAFLASFTNVHPCMNLPFPKTPKFEKISDAEISFFSGAAFKEVDMNLSV
ncbi:hypothetical protein Y032_0549g3291 [Ancylostoma ceylanicum]|uniref:Uncharacterized protein n=1 Tax=Ancylostoma ceylanicum TaxID=53326 RepID=A0A016WQT4_9BILA|nr:hypothetical protein Y032_0549g3291 [Ancylostoma ceylanicum]